MDELNSFVSQNDQYAFHSMAFDTVEELLKQVNRPVEMRNQITSFIRELTGAQLVIIFEKVNDESRLLTFNPQRKKVVAESDEVRRLAKILCARKEMCLWGAGKEDNEADELLKKIDAGISIGIPLILGDDISGSILVLNLPTLVRIELILSSLKLISSILSLSFKNSTLFENQENTISERTSEIRESQKRLTTLIGNLPGIVYRCPVDDLYKRDFIGSNSKNVLGYDEKYFSDKSFKDILCDEEIERLDFIFSKAKENNSDIELTYKICLPNKNIKWIWDKASIFYSESGEPLFYDGFLTDITEKKKSEEKEEEHYKFLQSILTTTRDGFWVVDTSRKFIEVNDAYCKMSGYSRDEILGLTLNDIDAEENQKQTEIRIKQIIETGHSLFERKHKRKDGSTFDVEMSTTYHKTRNVFVCFVRDITARKEIENVLQQSEERFRTAVLNAPFPIMLHAEDGTVEMINEEWTKITGYTQNEIPTIDKWTERAYGEKKVFVKDDIERLYSITEKVDEGEYSIKTKSGEKRIWYFNSTPIGKTQDGRRLVVSMALDFTERKNFEMQLAESEKRFRQIIERSNDVFYRQDIQAGRFEYVSPKVENMLGYTPDEFYRMTIEDQFSIMHPEDLPHSLNFVNDLIEADSHGDGFLEREFRLRKKSGEYCWVYGNYTLIKDDNNNPSLIVGSLSDISKRKTAESELNIALQHLKFHIINTPLAVIEFNHDYKVTKWSHNAEMMFGWRADEIIGKSINEMKWVYQEDGEKVARLSPRMQSNKNTSNIHVNRNYKKDGSVITCEWYNSALIDENGNLISVYSFVQDITDRIKLEGELSESVSLLAASLESTADGILVVNLDDCITVFNQRFAQMWKLPESDLKSIDSKSTMQLMIDQLKLPEEFLSKADYISKYPEKDSFDVLLLKDGRIIERYSRPQFIEHKPVGRVFSFRDITERIIAEEELEKHRNHLQDLVEQRTEEIDAINNELKKEIELKKKVEKELEKALEKEKELNKLKSRFISTASHEFRTPLASALMSADLIQRYAERWPKEKVDEHFDRIRSSILNLTKLMDDVIQINRSESGKITFKPELTDVKKLCKAVIEKSSIYMTELHKFEFHFECKQNIFNLDGQQTELILINLLSNAFKYSPNGGMVELVVESIDKKIFFTVKDSGIGIPEEDLPRLFEPFHRALNVEDIRGTGLGLSIVKNSVDTCGGKINVESKLLHGSTFYVEIPVIE